MKKRIDESLRLKELAGINKLGGAPKKAMKEDFDDEDEDEYWDKYSDIFPKGTYPAEKLHQYWNAVADVVKRRNELLDMVRGTELESHWEKNLRRDSPGDPLPD